MWQTSQTILGWRKEKQFQTLLLVRIFQKIPITKLKKLMSTSFEDVAPKFHAKNRLHINIVGSCKAPRINHFLKFTILHSAFPRPVLSANSFPCVCRNACCELYEHAESIVRPFLPVNQLKPVPANVISFSTRTRTSFMICNDFIFQLLNVMSIMVLWIGLAGDSCAVCGGVLKSQCRIIIKRFIYLRSMAMNACLLLFLQAQSLYVVSASDEFIYKTNVWCTSISRT